MNALVRLRKATSPFAIALLLLLPAPSLTAGVDSAATRGIDLRRTTVKGQPPRWGPAGSGLAVVPSPNTASPHNCFYGVAAITSTDVWAVGGYGNLTTVAHQLIQHWDGQNWALTPTPT